MTHNRLLTRKKGYLHEEKKGLMFVLSLFITGMSCMIYADEQYATFDQLTDKQIQAHALL